jgi:hypothetical protein
MLTAEDRLAIHELLALYGHVVDGKAWDELGQVFTDDASFDATELSAPVTGSLAELVALFSHAGAAHPVAHHATNIVIRPQPDGTAQVLSKGIGVGRKGRVGSVVYRDVAVRTSAGWRLRHRHASRLEVEP